MIRNKVVLIHFMFNTLRFNDIYAQTVEGATLAGCEEVCFYLDKGIVLSVY